MIEVYRIEHKETNLGPFQTRNRFTQFLAKKAGKCRYLKNPNDDGLYMAWVPFDYVFGSPSLATLKEWFFLGRTIDENQYIVNKLDELGFVLAEYLVEEGSYRYGVTGSQLVFDAISAREDNLVQYKSLSVLMRESPLVFCVN